MYNYRHPRLEVSQRVVWADRESAVTLGYVDRSRGQEIFTVTATSADPEHSTVRIGHPDPALARHEWQESWFKPLPALL